MHQTPLDPPGSNGCPHPASLTPLSPNPQPRTPLSPVPPSLEPLLTATSTDRQDSSRSRPIPASSSDAQHTTVSSSLRSFLPSGQIRCARPQAAKRNPAQRLGLRSACRRRGSGDSDLTLRRLPRRSARAVRPSQFRRKVIPAERRR